MAFVLLERCFKTGHGGASNVKVSIENRKKYLVVKKYVCGYITQNSKRSVCGGRVKLIGPMSSSCHISRLGSYCRDIVI